MPWLPLGSVSYVTAPGVQFDMLEHRADDLVVPDSGPQYRTGALGGFSILFSGPPPHEAWDGLP